MVTPINNAVQPAANESGLRDEVDRLRKVLGAIGGLTRERGTKDAVRTALAHRADLPPPPAQKPIR